MTVKELLDFFNYLERRGFLRDDLQCDPEHQIETYLNDFCNSDKSAETQYVDLGLPSGTLWATRNVGANNPEDYGDYFAWGETMPKSNYVWSTYKYGNAYNQLTKYCSDSSYGKDGYIDNIKRLNPEDDAATVNWGSDWRMPTKEEFDELINVCQWEWTTVNGKSCYRVTGPNGNSLFLPTAGYYDNGNHDNAGCYGYYWLSTYNNGYPYNAYYLHLDSSDFISFSDCYRYFGHSVRPVFKNKVKNITN